jgi:hypothetical protein
MISLQDCIEYLRLTDEELDAIAAHEHVPAIIAAELAAYLAESNDGERMIKRMIIDDIVHAEKTGNHARVENLTLTLKHFIATHPDLG